MEFEFDRQKFLKNIQAVMEQRGIKANELEAGTGLYSGYISRLKGTDDKIPPLDVAWKIAKFLNVNMEGLIEGNLDVTAANLDYVRRFIQRLYTETVANKIEWLPTSITAIDYTMMGREKKWIPAMQYDENQDFGDCRADDEALMIGHESGSYLSLNHWRIRSFTRVYSSPWIEDTCYQFEMSPTETFYLMPYGCVIHTDPEDYDGSPDILLWYELVIVTKNEGGRTVTPVCNNLDRCQELTPDIERLYNEIKDNVSNFRVFAKARSAIDSFMYSTDPDRERETIPESFE